ncbi:uncharacterized protein LOC108989411 isoform X2 [Juglans regia]|uniref:Uncharacterized protein LOC108989411 isoform X2 n=1 Tax=Juglans regia TaxID=51240 RepID=A0A2I4EGL6_JUGRE|nr:uncharacterized protein LOC108989411 isoform X2 [Juglans regia]
MEPMKFVCLLLVLISSTTTARLSLAHPSQDTKLAAGKEAANAIVSSAKGLLEDESWAVTACTNKKIKGRKMQTMGRNNIGTQDHQKKEHAGAVAGRTTSNIPSSNQVAGKYKGHEEGKNGGSNSSSSSSVEHDEQNVYRSSEQIDDEAAGFVAFNADYHEPRHHPPKNN